MSANVTIRLARLPEEAPQLVAFVHALQMYEYDFEPNRRTDALVAGEFFDVLMKEVGELDGRVFVAEARDGTLLGWAVTVALKDEVFVNEEDRPYGNIAELFVTSEVRGQGVGKALADAAEADFRARGFHIVSIGVMMGNDRARRAYQSWGFAPYAMRLRKSI